MLIKPLVTVNISAVFLGDPVGKIQDILVIGVGVAQHDNLRWCMVRYNLGDFQAQERSNLSIFILHAVLPPL